MYYISRFAYIFPFSEQHINTIGPKIIRNYNLYKRIQYTHAQSESEPLFEKLYGIFWNVQVFSSFEAHRLSIPVVFLQRARQDYASTLFNVDPYRAWETLPILYFRSMIAVTMRTYVPIHVCTYASKFFRTRSSELFERTHYYRYYILYDLFTEYVNRAMIHIVRI